MRETFEPAISTTFARLHERAGHNCRETGVQWHFGVGDTYYRDHRKLRQHLGRFNFMTRQAFTHEDAVDGVNLHHMYFPESHRYHRKPRKQVPHEM